MHGLVATHQRQVLYGVMQPMPGHPSVEEKNLGAMPAPSYLPRGFQAEHRSIDMVGLRAASRQADAARTTYP